MELYKVNVNKLNLRSGPVQSFANKENVVAVLPKDAIFRSLSTFTNELSDWLVNREGQVISKNFATPLDPLPEELEKYHALLPKTFLDFKLGTFWKWAVPPDLKLGIIDTGHIKHDAIKQKVEPLNYGQKEIAEADLRHPNHATTMACIICGYAPEEGIVGVAPQIKEIHNFVLPKVEPTPQCFIDALTMMENKDVRLINISYCWSDVSREHFAVSEELTQKIKSLCEKGYIIVCATGNEHDDDEFYYPAAYADTVSVAGCTKEGKQDYRSNIWDGISVCMCSDFYLNEKRFPASNGTSAASALIAGILAHMYEQLPGINKITAAKHSLVKCTPLSFKTSKHSFSIPIFNTNQFLQ